MKLSAISILKEMCGYRYTIDQENPDVLGIWDNDLTVNIECKVSRSDFFADKNKLHDHPIGNMKIYACPYNLIKEDEIPKEWGLLYINGRGGKLIKHPIYQKATVDVTTFLADIIINGVNAGVLTSEHKKRPYRIWDGKGVVL